MEPTLHEFDEAPLNKGHIKVAVLAAMGAFLDGYDVFIISSVLLFLVPQFHLTHIQVGLLSSTSFFGALIGAYVFGHLGDRFGRRTIFLWDLLVFGLIAVLQGLTRDLNELLVLRFVLGLAVGADLPISAAIISEFSPRRYRGWLTSLMIAFLFVGGFLADITGIVLYHVIGAQAWRWMFFSGMIPAVVVLFFRRSIPESPRWLLASGERNEAIEVMQTIESHHTHYTKTPRPSRPRHGAYIELFRSPFLRLTVIVGAMWFLLNSMSSSFIVYTPTIIHTFGFSTKLKSLEYGAISYLITTAVVAVTGYYVDAIGRKKLMYGLMGATMIGTLLLLAQSSQHAANTAILVVGVILATVGLGASGVVVMNLGAELFPTPIRATSEGFAVGSNKLGAYIGTLVVPNILHTFKVTGLMVVVLGVVLVASVLMALIPIEPARQPLKQSGLLGSEPVMEEEHGA